ncbi:metallophosphoesterase [Psychrobacillus sp. OK032]|uniref:metallophosphoesterase n=1 Tax=Psychrobacillus sp. OK032 TaxID=1884358 RepID=UPI0008C1615E|nr:metallophosphoesterase [Psychrobacillus sp. OK032]SER77925.1 protein phosphatase [Psychrobacillus sp. OK032]
MIQVRRLQLDKTKRAIVISDIHANLGLFKNLLQKVDYTGDDYLFINGDLSEKGQNSLEVVEFVKNLSEQSTNVYVTKGNCDVVHRYVFNESEGVIPYMNRQKNSILNEMLAQHCKTLYDFTNLEELAHFYRQNFHDEIEWLESLPIAYETDDYIIIHAGIENRVDWHQTEENFALYTQAFYEQAHQSNKLVIVGHWPVVNYRASQASSHNPIIDLDKKIIALDGGNQIKEDGQLNALIIQNGKYTYTYVDELTSEMIVQKEHNDQTRRVGTLTYPNYDMQIIRQEKYFTLCKNINLGIEQWIKNEYLLIDHETVSAKTDVSTTFLSVKKGEKVWMVEYECDGYILVKRENGEVGWLPKDCL